MKSLLESKNFPCIRPIFSENKFVTDFREKAELFNSLFVNQCSLIKNTSVLPTNCENLTDKFLSNITFTDKDIGKIIKGLDTNKAHVQHIKHLTRLRLCLSHLCNHKFKHDFLDSLD